jgi:hypothetical protein
MTGDLTGMMAGAKTARRAQPAPVARSESVGSIMSDRQKSGAWFSHYREEALVEALAAELGPSWNAKAPTSLHGYFAPARGAGRHRVLSSCSGSPLSERARALCLQICEWIIEAPDRAAVRERIAGIDGMFAENVTRLVGAPAGTAVVLAASPADAFRLMGMLFSIEAKRKPLRVLVPTIGEIASAVPSGMEARYVEPGPRHGQVALEANIEVTQIPMRGRGGEVIDDTELARSFAEYSRKTDSLPLVYSSLGDATGLVGPRASGALALDASQMRLRPDRIGLHLSCGMPMVIAGSTFLGGPAESGALLVPPDRFPAEVLREARRRWRADTRPDWDGRLGPNRALRSLLRWLPALENLRQMVALGPRADTLVARMTMELTAFLGRFPDFHVFPGRDVHQVATCGREAGMAAFAVRDQKRPDRWLTMPELIALYHRLADAGVLIGHPVPVGARGALRLAIGAEDVIRGDIRGSLHHLEEAFKGLGFPLGPMRSEAESAPRGRQSATPHARCWN